MFCFQSSGSFRSRATFDVCALMWAAREEREGEGYTEGRTRANERAHQELHFIVSAIPSAYKVISDDLPAFLYKLEWAGRSACWSRLLPCLPLHSLWCRLISTVPSPQQRTSELATAAANTQLGAGLARNHMMNCEVLSAAHVTACHKRKLFYSITTNKSKQSLKGVTELSLVIAFHDALSSLYN